jgi:predicted aldo/keto reductase-like oxidoreductase
LPRIDEDPASINEVEATNMLRYAIDHGVNYLDLGYFYDKSKRERLSRLIGRTLQDGYREKIKVAASLPSVIIHTAVDIERYIDTQTSMLGIENLDFFFLGGINRQNLPELPLSAVLRKVEVMISDGRLGRLGFSFHDDFQLLRTVLDAYDDWSLCQFQYSFMDVDHHPGIGGLKYAADKGLAVVITEPLKGGRLTRELPESAAKIWAGAYPKRSPAEWGLRWVWNQPEVATVVSDMRTMEQVIKNIALADKVIADSLTVPEELLINQVRDAYRNLKPISCTGCRGCMPCPQNIDVPRIFELYNDAIMYNDIEISRSIYRDEGHGIDSCNECGICEKACGRKIPITDWLRTAHELLAGDE